MVPRWRFLLTFLHPVFAASRVQRISDLHSKYALSHTMCQSMVNIQSPTAEIRRGKKEEEEERNSMKILWSALLHRATIINFIIKISLYATQWLYMADSVQRPSCNCCKDPLDVLSIWMVTPCCRWGESHRCAETWHLLLAPVTQTIVADSLRPLDEPSHGTS